jgi:hypothetical protein
VCSSESEDDDFVNQDKETEDNEETSIASLYPHLLPSWLKLNEIIDIQKPVLKTFQERKLQK